MYAAKRSLPRPVYFALILTVLLLAGCGVELANENWPGLSANGDTVYVAFGPGIYAVDVPERSVEWSFPDELGAGAPIFAAPSIENGRIVIGDYGQVGGMFSPGPTVSVYGLDADVPAGSAPNILWQNSDLASDRIIAQPTQSPSRAYFGTGDNDVFAVDVESGIELWRFAASHSIWGQPSYRDGILYVGALDGSVYALDAESGVVLWEQTLPGAIASGPAIADETLFLTTFDRRLHALDIDTGAERWSNEAEAILWGAPIVGEDAVYYADVAGNVYAVSLAGESLWTTQAGGLIQSAPVLANGAVYVASGNEEDGDVPASGELLALDAETGDELWRRILPAPILTTPVVVGDEIVLAPLNYSSLLLVYDLESGNQTWEFVPPSSE